MAPFRPSRSEYVHDVVYIPVVLVWELCEPCPLGYRHRPLKMAVYVVEVVPVLYNSNIFNINL